MLITQLKMSVMCFYRKKYIANLIFSYYKKVYVIKTRNALSPKISSENVVYYLEKYYKQKFYELNWLRLILHKAKTPLFYQNICVCLCTICDKEYIKSLFSFFLYLYNFVQNTCLTNSLYVKTYINKVYSSWDNLEIYKKYVFLKKLYKFSKVKILLNTTALSIPILLKF